MENTTVKEVGVFLVGSRKSGTTSLANFLNSHIDVSLSKIKEPNFFSGSNSLDINTYHSLFDWSKKIQLDASTEYTALLKNTYQIAKAIHSYNRNAKIIYLVRNPIDRIISHYRMTYERGDVANSLDESIIANKLLIDCSKYYSQIKIYTALFGRSTIEVIKTEDLNNIEYEDKLINFLDLQTKFDRSILTDNAADSDYRMPKSIDFILTNKIYQYIKSSFPKSVTEFVKSRYYHSRNKNMSITLNTTTKRFIKQELLPEMKGFQSIVDFDITDWIDTLEKL